VTVTLDLDRGERELEGRGNRQHLKNRQLNKIMIIIKLTVTKLGVAGHGDLYLLFHTYSTRKLDAAA